MILDRGGREDIRQQWGVISGVATGYIYHTGEQGHAQLGMSAVPACAGRVPGFCCCSLGTAESYFSVVGAKKTVK